MKYSELSSEEQLEWDMKDWGSDESGDPLEAPGEITSAEMNRVLYNLDTIRQVLTLLPRLECNGVIMAQSGVQDQPGQHGKTLSLLKIQKKKKNYLGVG